MSRKINKIKLSNLEDYPPGEGLETPLTPKRMRVWPPSRTSTPSPSPPSLPSPSPSASSGNIGNGGVLEVLLECSENEIIIPLSSTSSIPMPEMSVPLVTRTVAPPRPRPSCPPRSPYLTRAGPRTRGPRVRGQLRPRNLMAASDVAQAPAQAPPPKKVPKTANPGPSNASRSRALAIEAEYAQQMAKLERGAFERERETFKRERELERTALERERAALELRRLADMAALEDTENCATSEVITSTVSSENEANPETDPIGGDSGNDDASLIQISNVVSLDHSYGLGSDGKSEMVSIVFGPENEASPEKIHNIKSSENDGDVKRSRKVRRNIIFENCATPEVIPRTVSSENDANPEIDPLGDNSGNDDASFAHNSNVVSLDTALENAGDVKRSRKVRRNISSENDGDVKRSRKVRRNISSENCATPEVITNTVSSENVANPETDPLGDDSGNDDASFAHNSNVVSLDTALGSEEESSDDDEDDVTSVPLPRTVRIFLPEEEEATPVEVPLQVNLEWPPPPPPAHTSSSADVPPTAPSPSSPSSPIALGPNKWDFEWVGFEEAQVDPKLRREAFSVLNPGPTKEYASAYSAFAAVWDRRIMNHIATQTNLYAQQLAEHMLSTHITPRSRITRWVDTSSDELYLFFATILAMGMVVKSRLREYWDSSRTIFSTPFFTSYISIDRFSLLSRCLHFNDNTRLERTASKGEAKLFKVLPIVQHLNNKFASLYEPDRNVAIDESLAQWKGLLNIKQFIPNKTATEGVKTYELCESRTGYLWRFEVHTGFQNTVSHEDPISGTISALVLRLLKGLEHKGHTVWMDNYYNSPALARELKLLGFDCVGTLRTNRKFVPAELANLTLADMLPGQVLGCTSTDVDLIVWRDKRRVALISTYHGLATVECNGVLKPTVVHDYNICMGGVDRKDQMLAAYPIERKRTRVWYKKFFRRLLNASVLNAYILYKATHQITHYNFRKALVLEILSRHGTTSPKRAIKRPVDTHHFPQHLSKGGGSEHQRQRRQCVVCKKRTTTYCPACQVNLCLYTCYNTYAH